MIVWADSIETIILLCADFDARLIKQLWRTRPKSAMNTPTSSVIGHATPMTSGTLGSASGSGRGLLGAAGGRGAQSADLEKRPSEEKFAERKVEMEQMQTKKKRTWYGRQYVPADKEKSGEGGDESEEQERRPIALFSPVYNGLAAGLALGSSILLSTVIVSDDGVGSVYWERH